jgi:integrase
MVTSKTFDRLEDAKAFQDEQTGRRRKGELLDASKARRTVNDLWIYFSETRETRGGRAIKPSTFASYTTRWRTHIQPSWGDYKVGEVQRDHLKRWLREPQAKTSTDTRRKTQQVVHKLFAVAVSENWLARNPADGIGMPSAKVMRETQALTDEQVAKIAAEVPENYRALVWTLAETGMRIGEATALRVKNLGMPELFIKREPDDVPDLGVQKLNGGIRVVENAPEVSGVRMLGTPKSDESERVVPISPGFASTSRPTSTASIPTASTPRPLCSPPSTEDLCCNPTSAIVSSFQQPNGRASWTRTGSRPPSTT